MQVNSHQRAIAILILCMFCSLFQAANAAQGQQSGCALNPMEVQIHEMHLRNVATAQAITKLAIENSICIGAEDLVKAEKRLSIDIHSGSVGQALNSLLPKYTVSIIDSHVLNIKSGKARQSWLDYRLKSFRVNRVTLYFGDKQLFQFLKDQVNPSSGYIGSVAEPITDNYVGPLSEENLSIRQLLSRLLAKSTRGGLWLTSVSPQMSEPLPADPFWTMIPFGGSTKEALDKVSTVRLE